LRSLARQVTVCDDQDQLEGELRRVIRDQVQPSQKAVAAKLRENGFDSGLTVTQTVLCAGIGLMSSGVRPALSGLLGLGVGLAFSVFRWRLANERLRKDPFAYLCHARRQFGLSEDNS
jgi:hypothetical protein